MTDWVVQRDSDGRWAAGYVDGNNGFRMRFDSLEEAVEQATWRDDPSDRLTFWDERGQVITDPRSEAGTNP